MVTNPQNHIKEFNNLYYKIPNWTDEILKNFDKMKVFENYFVYNNVNMVLQKFESLRKSRKLGLSNSKQPSRKKTENIPTVKTARQITNIKDIFFKKDSNQTITKSGQ